MRRRASEKPTRMDAGHTLMEVLVALGVFVFLGSALIAFLSQGVGVWHLAEERGRIYERARAILDTAAEDLRSLSSDVRAEGTGFWVRLICDRDPRGRQRLRFVKTLPGETSDPIALHGGEYLARADSRHYDHHADALDVERGRLLAPAGYQEVLYTVHENPADAAGDGSGGDTLWRGVRSPIGGVGSLFTDSNIEEEVKPKSTTGASSSGGDKAKDGARRRSKISGVAQPLAGGVLYFGVRFWTPYTNTWDDAHPAMIRPGPGKPSGPTSYWDSTRAILRTTGKAGELRWSRIEGSIDDPLDDIFPERVEITLVLAGSPELEPIYLTRNVTSGDKSIPVSSAVGLPAEGPFRYVRVDDEWIRYEKIEGDTLVLGSRGERGARETAAEKHSSGARVLVGTSFRRVVEVPTYRIPIVRGERSNVIRVRGR